MGDHGVREYGRQLSAWAAVSSRRTFLRRAALSAAALGAGPSLLAACGNDSDTGSAADGEPTGPITFALATQQPQTLIPGLAFDLGSTMVAWMAWSGLYSYDAESGEPIPAEAADYQSSSNGREHKFTVTSGLQWSDGTPHTAQDYLFGARYRFDKGLLFDPPWLVGMLDTFEGAGFDALGIEVPDDQTVIFRTTDPIPFMEYWVAGEYYYWALPAHVLTDDAAEEALNQADPFVGNGPYVVTANNAEEVAFARNQNWSAGEEFPGDEFTFSLFPSVRDPAVFTAFRGSDQDVVTLGIQDIPAAQADPELAERTTTLEWQNPFLLVLNTLNPPLDDVLVRRALYAALDREAMAEDLFLGTATPAYQLLGPTFPGHDPERLPFDVGPDEARAFLSEAGFEGGEGFPTLSYTNLGIAGAQQVGQVVQEMWSDVLGVELDVRRLDAPTWTETVFGPAEGWDHVIDLSWPEYFGDPADSLYGLYSFSGLYVHHGWDQGEELQAQQDAAVYEADPEVRDGLLADYDFAVIEEVPVIPLVFINDAQVRQPGVEGAYVAYGNGMAAIRSLRRTE